MNYLLLVYSPESAWTREEWLTCTVASGHVCRDLQAQGAFIAASPLHPVATAASVGVRNGASQVTVGPFAETTEQLGGFFLINVPSLDDAIAVAARLPSAQKGTIEIRPVQHLDGLPSNRFAEPLANPVERTRYMLLCYDDERAWLEAGAATKRAAQTEAVALAWQLVARGQYVAASPLHPVSTATSVRIRQGKRLITDGPFAETRECLDGYYVIEARDLNDAITVAALHPGASVGTVEVRHLFDLASLPVTIPSV